jgi:hypothetical protein
LMNGWDAFIQASRCPQPSNEYLRLIKGFSKGLKDGVDQIPLPATMRAAKRRSTTL